MVCFPETSACSDFSKEWCCQGRHFCCVRLIFLFCGLRAARKLSNLYYRHIGVPKCTTALFCLYCSWNSSYFHATMVLWITSSCIHSYIHQWLPYPMSCSRWKAISLTWVWPLIFLQIIWKLSQYHLGCVQLEEVLVGSVCVRPKPCTLAPFQAKFCSGMDNWHKPNPSWFSPVL